MTPHWIQACKNIFEWFSACIHHSCEIYLNSYKNLKTFGGGLCHSPYFGFVSKLKHDKGSGPRKCIGFQAHSYNCGKMNPNTSKWILTMRVGVLWCFKSLGQGLGTKPYSKLGLRPLKMSLKKRYLKLRFTNWNIKYKLCGIPPC